MGKPAAKAASKLVREVVEDITKGVRKADAPDLSRGPRKPRGKPRADVPDPRPGASRPDPSRVDRGDGRDRSGRFTGKGGYGKDKEKIGLDRVEHDWGLPLERQQVLLHVDGLEQGRYYDGLLEVGQDTYMGVEVKSGSASLTAKQREFDGTISPATPAVGMLNGRSIKIIGTILERVE